MSKTIIPYAENFMLIPRYYSYNEKSPKVPPFLFNAKYNVAFETIDFPYLKKSDTSVEYITDIQKICVARLYVKQDSKATSSGNGTELDPCTSFEKAVKFLECFRGNFCTDALEICIVSGSELVDLSFLQERNISDLIITGLGAADTEHGVIISGNIGRNVKRINYLRVKIKYRYENFELPSCRACILDIEAARTLPHFPDTHIDIIACNVKASHIKADKCWFYGCTIESYQIEYCSVIADSKVTVKEKNKIIESELWEKTSFLRCMSPGIIVNSEIKDYSENPGSFRVQEMYKSSYIIPEGRSAKNNLMSGLHTLVDSTITYTVTLTDSRFSKNYMILVNSDFRKVTVSNSNVKYKEIHQYDVNGRHDYTSSVFYLENTLAEFVVSNLTVKHDVEIKNNGYGYKTTCLCSRSLGHSGLSECIWGCDIDVYSSGDDMDNKPSCDKLPSSSR